MPDLLEEEYFRTLKKTVQYCVEKISGDWDREFLNSLLLLLCAVNKNHGLYKLLDIASSKFDEEFLLKLYYES